MPQNIQISSLKPTKYSSTYFQGIIEEMPVHIKKVCLALENSNQLSSALSQYIRNEAAGTTKLTSETFYIFIEKILQDFSLLMAEFQTDMRNMRNF